MMQKLFDGKNYEKKCAYCAFGKTVEGDSQVLCARNGVMDENDCCKKYQYDPLKRRPQRPNLQTDFKEEDFAL